LTLSEQQYFVRDNASQSRKRWRAITPWLRLCPRAICLVLAGDLVPVGTTLVTLDQLLQNYWCNWLTLVILGLIPEKLSVCTFILPGPGTKYFLYPSFVGPAYLRAILQVYFGSRCLRVVRSVTGSLPRPFSLACAVGHAAVFAVNATLVASQWQHSAWTVRLHPSINVENEAGQAASNIFQIFDIKVTNEVVQTDRESDTVYQLWWRAQLTRPFRPIFVFSGCKKDFAFNQHRKRIRFCGRCKKWGSANSSVSIVIKGPYWFLKARFQTSFLFIYMLHNNAVLMS